VSAPPPRIGTSGWSYPGWRQGFYEGVPQRRWLEHCAGHFTAIEVNATFYRLLKPETYEHWHEQTPDGFAFAIKGSRFVTHVHRLAGVAESIVLQRDRVAGLGSKLRVVLWQMPPSLKKDTELLKSFAEALAAWPRARHALEFRHTSWFDDQVAGVMSAHGLAVCQSDAAKWPLWEEVTTDLVYVRLHGHERTYASRYDDAALETWADRLRAWMAEGRQVHVYFDNDAEGWAPYDAIALLQKLGATPKRDQQEGKAG
jgi:uncharacterized protein YecE (DUF72 family)